MSVVAGHAPGAESTGAVSTGLTPLFVRLKLSLLKNGLRQSSGRRTAFIISAVLVLVFSAFLVLGLILLRETQYAPTVTVLLALVTAVAWAFMPLFFPSGDETLDPSRLVMLPLRPRPLVRALLAASLVGIGPLFTVCLAVGSVIAVAHGFAAAVTAVVAAALLVLTCLALARAVATANVRLLTSRRGRDLAVLSGLIIAVGIQFVNFGWQRLAATGGMSVLEPVANVVQWLPPASAVGAVHSMSEGAYGRGLVQLLLTLVVLAALLWSWERGLVKLMTAPDGSTIQAASDSARKESKAGLLTRLLPDGRTAATAQRVLRYIWRDPKTKGAWITSLAIGLIVPVFNALQGTGSAYWACFAAGMLGMQTFNQFGTDTSAFWMVATTISTVRDAYEELRARLLALLVITVPYTLLVAGVTTALAGDWSVLPEVLGLAFALLGALLAAGLVASALYPYSVPQDGTYKNVVPGQGSLAWMSLLVGLVVSTVVCAPLIALTVWLHVAGLTTWFLLPLGIAYGVLVTWIGLKVAAPRTAARLPEILAAVSKG
ncbi:transporter [Streptomyces spiroverticillatus]|uniref:Transporter n=1 Tax=Streptomyces finlayi TaxID=67296 RepID=A0A919CC34_9ACTN|nr:transporter [Streptomyces finlayi]GHA20306.1 transporter [Streptomyces spiroverticillatus]GHD03113.1 transporter [Streptomyces finlayi]